MQFTDVDETPPTARELARARQKKYRQSETGKAKEKDYAQKPARITATRKRTKRQRADHRQQRIEDIAILDVETDPFDNTRPDEKILPFMAVIYSETFNKVFWEENYETLVQAVVAYITGLPRTFTIYAHNGGKFDWLFFFHALRGPASFKGRGLMEARIGNHILRDSFHILPERLSNMQKESFDYSKMLKSRRRNATTKAEIIKYCVSDCAGLLPYVRSFVEEFGFKLSIGQAAIAELKTEYTYERLTLADDDYLRPFFFGGRVNCIRGAGHFHGAFKLYDVNSMYSRAMAGYRHPVAGPSAIRGSSGGPHVDPNERTYFLEVSCENNGAFLYRDDKGVFGEKGNITTQLRRGTFHTTIWEYKVAKQFGLIRDETIHRCIDFDQVTDFSRFVLPRYERRQADKAFLKEWEKAGRAKEGEAYQDAKKRELKIKLILNNAYGKFAQNPRRFKETYVCGYGQNPPDPQEFEQPWREVFKSWDQDIPLSRSRGRNETAADFQLWRNAQLEKVNASVFYLFERGISEKKMARGLNNVATGASITGASRAILLEALQYAEDPIYCDTDSIICKSLHTVPIHPTELGAWDKEAEFDEIIIVGKKSYACRNNGKLLELGSVYEDKIKSKGVEGLIWNDFVRMLAGEELSTRAKAPTISRDGSQRYMDRTARRTAPLMEIAA